MDPRYRSIWIARLASRRVALLAGAAFALALLMALELVRPFVAGPVGFDSAASVIHFDRIVSGRHLEAFVTTTPKPLLTVVYGLLHGLTGDWRAISLATIVVFAACVVLGGWLAWRVGGPAAGVFAVVGLLGSEALLADVGIAYGLPWALLFWLIAGLAMTSARSRPYLAGFALCLATLARLETLVVVVAATIAIAAAVGLGRLNGRRMAGGWWPIALGLVALPLMLIHDWLLTGDPFFWITVSTRYSLAVPDSVLTPIELVRLAATRYLGMALLLGLAAVGTIVLVRRRDWVPLVGVVALGPGIGAFLLLLAARGTYVSPRYFGAVDLAVILAAAIGAGAAAGTVTRALAGALGGDGRRLITAAAVAGVAILAIAASWPIPSLNASFRSSTRAQRTLAEHLDRTMPTLKCLIAGLATSQAPTGGVTATPGPADLVLLGPTNSRPRLVEDLRLPLYSVGGTSPAILEPGPGFLADGRLIIHDRLSDRDARFNVLEVSRPTTIGAVTLVPILVDAEAGLWLLRIDRPGSFAPAGC